MIWDHKKWMSPWWVISLKLRYWREELISKTKSMKPGLKTSLPKTYPLHHIISNTIFIIINAMFIMNNSNWVLTLILIRPKPIPQELKPMRQKRQLLPTRLITNSPMNHINNHKSRTYNNKTIKILKINHNHLIDKNKMSFSTNSTTWSHKRWMPQWSAMMPLNNVDNNTMRRKPISFKTNT